jgi:hypothetical protein
MTANLMRKGDFARMINVTPGRISQYIKARQIDGDAIVGAGPRAMIDADIACRQLQLRLDDNQMASLNGLNTRLHATPPASRPSAASSAALAVEMRAFEDATAALAKAILAAPACLDVVVSEDLLRHPTWGLEEDERRALSTKFEEARRS